jgi:hypothetical protein
VVPGAGDVWPTVCAKPDNVMTNRKRKAMAKRISTLLPWNITPPLVLPSLVHYPSGKKRQREELFHQEIGLLPMLLSCSFRKV